MPRYKLTVAYDGTGFHGWQKQHPPGQEPLRTVQGVLEDAIFDLFRETVNVLGASRTDAGVHARRQVAAFTATREFSPPQLVRALNSRLPDDVQVRRAALTDPTFSPISDATAKGYRYRIAHSCSPGPRGGPRPLFDRHFTYWTPEALDPSRMHEAEQLFVGEHDFTSFTRLNHNRESTVRTVFGCAVRVTGAHRCRFDISGDGFLYNMVRIIAGTLTEVGRGAIEPAAITDILAKADRREAGPTLAPEGLCLMWVRYEGVRS